MASVLGGTISTRSVCTFPNTFSEAALEIYRANTSAAELSPADCTRTYGEFLGVGWILFQVCIAATNGLYVVPVLLHRLWRLKAFAKSVHRPYMSLTQPRVYLCALAIAVALLAEMVDPLGFHDLVVPHVYFLCDEVIASTCFVLALLIVDFWCLCAKGMRRNQSGLPKSVMASLSLLAYANFIGFQVTGMLDYSNYFVWEGVKMFCGVLLLFVIAAVAWFYVRRIERSLLAIQASQADSEAQEFGQGTSPAQNSGSGSGDKDDLERGEPPKPKPSAAKIFKTKSAHALKKAATSVLNSSSSNLSPTARIIKQLKAKYRQFFLLIGLSSLVMCANGALAIARPAERLSWGYDVLEVDVYVFAAVLKVLYTLVALLVIRFFHVPGGRPSAMASSSKTGGSSNPPNSSSNIPANSSFVTSLANRVAPFSSKEESGSYQSDYPRPSRTQVASIYDMDEGRTQANEVLQSMLKDPVQRAEFLAFCETMHGHESVLCYAAILDFESEVAKGGSGTPGALAAAKHVLATFLVEGAPYPVNISAHNLASIRQHARRDGSPVGITAASFSRIKRELFDIMDDNFFGPFQETRSGWSY